MHSYTHAHAHDSNIVLASQVIDDVLLVTAKKTCALELLPKWGFLCISEDQTGTIISDSPFGTSAYTISLGYLLVALIAAPLSYMALDNNVVFQVAGVLLICISVLIWVLNFAVMGLSFSNLPAFVTASNAPPGPSWFSNAYSQVIPNVLFNFGFVTTCPSWFNEKAATATVKGTVPWAVVISTFLYLLLGFFGALAPLDYSGGATLLSVLVDPSTPNVWLLSKVAVYVFPASNLITSIPVFAVMIRYNLVNGGLMTPFWGNMVSFFFFLIYFFS